MSYATTRLRSYQDCVNWLKDIKNGAVTGRAVSAAGYLRLFKVGDDYAVYYYQEEVCRFHPDNTLTITPGDQGEWDKRWRIAGSYHYLPFNSSNTGRKGIDRIIHCYPGRWTPGPDAGYQRWLRDHGLKNEWSAQHKYFKHHAPIAYGGLKLNLTTGEWMNVRPELDPKNWKRLEEVPEQRKAWRRAIRKLRTVARAQHRLGIFENSSLPPPSGYSQEAFTEIVYRALSTGVVTPDFFQLLCSSGRLRHRWHGVDHSLDDVEQAFRNALNRANRHLLKQRFGVYKQPLAA